MSWVQEKTVIIINVIQTNIIILNAVVDIKGKLEAHTRLPSA